MPTRIQSLLIACAAALLIATPSFAQADREEEIQRYITLFSSTDNESEVVAACQQLEWLGLNDPRMFDVAEQRLLALYKTADHDDFVAMLAWQAKALAFSGQEKYRATLSEVAMHGKDKRLRRHASASLSILDSYIEWQPLITDTTGYRGDQPEPVNRYATMLKTRKKKLQAIAAKRIIAEQIDNQYLLDLLRDLIEPELLHHWQDRNDASAVAHMLKALAQSGKAEYRPTLEKAAEHAGTDRIRKYAKSYLRHYY